MMERKYFSSKELPQRSHEWFIKRMGIFTSSPAWQLFTEPTQEKRATEALDYLKVNGWKGSLNHKLKKDSHFTFCFKWLGIDDPKERKALKVEIKSEQSTSKESKKQACVPKG